MRLVKARLCASLKKSGRELSRWSEAQPRSCFFFCFGSLRLASGLINRTFLPPFSEVVVKGVQFAAAGKLLPQILVSLGRAAGGFGLGVVTAIPLGVLLGWYRPLEAYLNPLLQLLRQTNPVSLFPAFILFFGIGYATNVAIIYWVVVWPILLGTVNGVRQADPALVKYARSVGLPDWQNFHQSRAAVGGALDHHGHASCRDLFLSHAGRLRNGRREQWPRLPDRQRAISAQRSSACTSG